MEIKSFKEFEKALGSNKLQGTVLLCGDEKHLIDQSIELFYKSITSFPDLNITKLDGENITLDAITNACETLPFLSDKKIVHIKRSTFLSKGGASSSDINKGLSNYVKGLSGEVVLILSHDGPADTSSTLYKTLKSVGTIIEYKKIKGEELANWVQSIFENNKKRINKVEINYLISEAGNSMELLEREVEKICSFALEEDLITKSHIDAVIHRTIESNVFKMVDNIAKRDANAAISILNLLLFQKEDHLKILGMIIRQIRLLFIIKSGLNEKRTPQQINSELKLNEYVFNNLVKLSRGYDEHSLRNYFNKCLETDIKIKSGGYSHEFYGLALEILIVELCK